jgi:1,4-alpha-glucan branching enzyme
MTQGYVALVLHGHLPYVRHPEHEYFLEENWLFEAITECYVPLLDAFTNLERDGVDFCLTMSLTPPLMGMLADDLLIERFYKHISRLIELAEKEIDRTRNDPAFHGLAQMYYDRFTHVRKRVFDEYGGRLIKGFKHFSDSGNLEIITCAATHGYLPLMRNPRAIYAQVEQGCRQYEDHLGHRPSGIWLAECGYVPGVDEVLRHCGLRYFFVDTHGLLYSNPRPKNGVFAPIYTPGGVAAFGRDMDSSKSVWSSKEGYPGDFSYRDFYRDVGYDLEFDYIKPYIHPDGIRINTGVKYYRITGESDHKEPYNPDWARETAADHAGNFMYNREKQIEHLAPLIDRKPLVVAPYDAELYGHWWFEGPQFLEFLFRKVAYDQDVWKFTTPMRYLSEYPTNQVAMPAASSWGYKGYHEFWLEGSNHWIYRHLHKMADLMTALAADYSAPDDLQRRTLNQAARELLLAQASDWAFIMKTDTVVDYAIKRTKHHVDCFLRLHDMIRWGEIDGDYLAEIEHRDNLFPNIDYRIYA